MYKEELLHLQSPLNETTLKIFGSYLIIMFMLCMVLNTVLLLIFILNKELRIPFNMTIIMITSINLLSTIQFPLVIHSSFSSKWTSKKFGCILSGYIMYFVGCVHVYMMSVISFERYYVLKEPKNMRKITQKKMHIILTIIIILSLFWPTMPLIGWSHYIIEDGHISCSIQWKERNFNVVSYNIAMFIFVFVIPFSVILITNFKSFLFVSFVVICLKNIQYKF